MSIYGQKRTLKIIDFDYINAPMTALLEAVST